MADQHTIVVQQARLEVPARFQERLTVQVRLMNQAGQVIAHRQTLRSSNAGVSVGEVALRPDARERTFSGEAAAGEPVSFGDGVRLLGFKLAPEDEVVRQGEQVPVTVVWQAEGEPRRSYTVTMQLLSRDGRLLAQHDDRPAGGAAPTESWQKGERVDDLHTITVPEDAAGGSYRIIVAAYDTKTGERLLTGSGADHAVLGEILVRRPPGSQGGPPTEPVVGFEEVPSEPVDDPEAAPSNGNAP